jgi:HAD superfamily hydrolase (TIGR01549 family)
LIKAVVFDLDGTLVDLPINWEALFIEFKKITHLNNVRPLATTIPKVDEKTKKKVFDAWDKAEYACAEQIIANDEGMKIYLEHAGKPKALVTLQGKKIVKIILEKFKLSFDVVFTREESLNRATQLKSAAKKLKMQTSNILFVGNAETDAHAAEKVGCQFLKV